MERGCFEETWGDSWGSRLKDTEEWQTGTQTRTVRKFVQHGLCPAWRASLVHNRKLFASSQDPEQPVQQATRVSLRKEDSSKVSLSVRDPRRQRG